MQINRPIIYAIDFDGTLCENAYPEIGEPKMHIINMVRDLKRRGDKLILWTCRCGKKLDEAVFWCEGYGITFDAINSNLPECIEEYGNDCRKINADRYLDDKNVFCPDVNDPSSIGSIRGITRKEILTGAIECVCGGREQDYGTPEDCFGTIARMWMDYLRCLENPACISPKDVAVMMALLKIARIANGKFQADSFIDACGYLACGGEFGAFND